MSLTHSVYCYNHERPHAALRAGRTGEALQAEQAKSYVENPTEPEYDSGKEPEKSKLQADTSPCTEAPLLSQ